MKAMTLVNKIEFYIRTGDADGSQRIVDTYRAATLDQKRVIDDIFMSLCGYALCTLIEGTRYR
jgi:hypothetical protein